MDVGEPPPEDAHAGPITMDAERSELEASGALALALDQATASHGHGKQPSQGPGQQPIQATASSRQRTSQGNSDVFFFP